MKYLFLILGFGLGVAKAKNCDSIFNNWHLNKGNTYCTFNYKFDKTSDSQQLIDKFVELIKAKNPGITVIKNNNRVEAVYQQVRLESDEESPKYIRFPINFKMEAVFY